MKECIFCKIAKGELDSAKIWEDEEFFAFLDIYPNTKGMALVIPKKHYDSYAFGMSDEFYSKLMLAAKKVALLLDKKLNVKRTAMVMEGMGVDHVHIKLYPLYGLDKKFEERIEQKRIFFKEYGNYITTQLGPKADTNELKKLAEKIRS